MDQEVLTIRIDRALADKLDQLTQDCDCTRDELLRDAVAQFVEEQSELFAALKEGEADLAAGRFVTHEQLIERLRIDYARKDAA